MPALTVLLPVRNGERYLAAALRSTVRALPRDAEVLVIDDASDDATASIAAAAAAHDPRVRIHRRSRSRGLPAALNDGISRTDSRFLARMDADDVCLPTRFRRQLLSLRRLDFIFGSSVLIDAGSKATGVSTPLPVRPTAARYHLLIGNFFSHPTMACRREAMERLGGYRDTVVEDFDLWLRAVAAGARMAQSPLPAIAYRMHEAQVTQRWNLDAADPTLDAAYARLLPPHLRDRVELLRHSAVTRIRTTNEERAAWAALVSWLEKQSAVLRGPDRIGLRLRLRSQSPDAAA